MSFYTPTRIERLENWFLFGPVWRMLLAIFLVTVFLMGLVAVPFLLYDRAYPCLKYGEPYQYTSTTYIQMGNVLVPSTSTYTTRDCLERAH